MQFARAVQTLCDAEVEFIIIGGLSATFHGSARITYDLDICYSRSAANISRIVKALAPFRPRPRGFPKELPFLWDVTTLRNSTILTLQTELGEIDLLAEVSGLGTFEVIRPQSLEVQAFERAVFTLDLPSLIRAKKATGREKDISHLSELEGLLESDEIE